jgi:ABC-type nitrate/sulfonate/bicarbonate transport system substrate-binding protein
MGEGHQGRGHQAGLSICAIEPGTSGVIALNLLHVGSTTPCAAILLSVAGQQGIFARHGLDVRLVFVSGAKVPELTAGNPFGLFGAPAVVLRAAGGTELKILGCFNTGRISGRLIAAREIRRPQELAGARLGVRAVGAGHWIQTLLALEHLGLDIERDNIRTLPIGDESRITRALEHGEIDAAVVSPVQGHLLKARGFCDLLDIYPAKLHGFPDALAVTAIHLQQSSAVAQTLLAALVDSMAFSLASRNESAVVNTIMKLSGTTNAAAGRAGYREFLLTATPKPYPCLERLLRMQQIMALQNIKVLGVKVDDLIDDRFVRELDESGAIDRLYRRAACDGADRHPRVVRFLPDQRA